MITYVDVDKIKPAKYNPRKISEEQKQSLKESLENLGFVTPILVNERNHTIVAGHQRTNASKMLGYKKVPSFMIKNITVADEMSFNQLHNGIEDTYENNGHILNYKDLPIEQFTKVKAKNIKSKCDKAIEIQDISRLIGKYGNVFCAVICDGKIVKGSNYLKSCMLMNIDANVYNLSIEKLDYAKKYLFKEYGVFNYDSLQKDTFVQGLAQLNRNQPDELKEGSHESKLYRDMVLKDAETDVLNDTILDFGCGKGEYIGNIAKRNKNAYGLEFYHNNTKGIIQSKTNRQFNRLEKHLNSTGELFDVVICDSVVNSTDSMEAEMNVLHTLNSFCKLGGTLFISGRNIKEVYSIVEARKLTNLGKQLKHFLDENNFSARYREGKWFYQHFHDKETIYKELQEAGFEVVKDNGWSNTSFQLKCKKVKESSLEDKIKAIDYEFTLPLPQGKRYKLNNRCKKMLNLV